MVVRLSRNSLGMPRGAGTSRAAGGSARAPLDRRRRDASRPAFLAMLGAVLGMALWTAVDWEKRGAIAYDIRADRPDLVSLKGIPS